jgi:hypothetical protein
MTSAPTIMFDPEALDVKSRQQGDQRKVQSQRNHQPDVIALVDRVQPKLNGVQLRIFRNVAFVVV